ncbi:uncharacterized protein ARMOST_18103 [Armillaria ostoyae]|uniref:Uncharacterized protein n=1 Tax=Armillaria ostoyae TaxID=47428 RepID=A0A284S0U9_ARMOS|nr:uncharacterized protein ARMOST_18103 [Armillaria ostoyae]
MSVGHMLCVRITSSRISSGSMCSRRSQELGVLELFSIQIYGSPVLSPGAFISRLQIDLKGRRAFALASHDIKGLVKIKE